MFRIAHISDLHIPPLPRIPLSQFASKRLLGLFSWHHKWKSEHKQKILDALVKHLDEMKPDHFCITGDITFTTHPEEVDTAADWIGRLGDANQISLIPGNHDAYVSGALDYVLKQWSPWMTDDGGEVGFPYLHQRGPVDIVGLCSAVPTPPAISLGRIGSEQLEKTEALLKRLSTSQRPSLLMLHHAPHDNAASPHRALEDRKSLQELLSRLPVDLVLHGHLHYPIRASLDGPSGPIPVRGAASASTLGKRKSVAHYHLIEVDVDGETPRLTIQHYHYDTKTDCFSHGEDEEL